MDGTITATALARHLIRRVPFEAKPVLLAVQEAAELARAAGGGAGAPTRRSGKRKRVSGGEVKGSGALAAVASLLQLARAAMQSPVLPLPVPVSSPPLRSERSENGETSGAAAGSSWLDGDPEGSTTRGEDGEAADASPAAATAELLLKSFVQSPAAVRRSIRGAMKKG